MNNLPVFPSGWLILVKQKKVEEVSKGGIITATHTETKRKQAGTDKGVLVAVGPLAWADERHKNQPFAKVGDEVLFKRYSGYQMEEDEDGTKYVVMNDDDVLGVIPKGADNV